MGQATNSRQPDDAAFELLSVYLLDAQIELQVADLLPVLPLFLKAPQLGVENILLVPAELLLGNRGSKADPLRRRFRESRECRRRSGW